MRTPNVLFFSAILLATAGYADMKSETGKSPAVSTDAPSAGAVPPANDPSAAKPAATASVNVLKAVLCKSLNERQPQDEVTSANVGDVLIGWNQLESASGDGSVTHRWLLNGQKVADVELQVRGSTYRTWSRKTVGEKGEWSWQILGADGSVLKETKFSVQ